MPAKNNAVWKTQNIWNEARETLAKRDSLIVFDLETTGLSRTKDRIIQIAAIRYGIDSSLNLTEQCTYHQYVNPLSPLSDEITKITGITNELLQDKPTEDEIFDDIQEFFEDDIVAGYNIESFDVKFMQELYGRQGALYSPIGIVDCIAMARNLLIKDVDVENYKLKTIGDYYGIKFNAHSALEDARATGKLLQIFLKEYLQQFEKPAAPLPSSSLKPNIKFIRFWEGFQGFSRIYVQTDCGSIYYDIRNNLWGGKDVDINMIDMAWLESEAYRIIGVSNQAEFSKFRGDLSA